MTTNTPEEHRVTPIDLSQIPHPMEPSPGPAEVLALAVAETALGMTGVHRLGTPVDRVAGRIRSVLPGADAVPGVTVDVTVTDVHGPFDLEPEPGS